MLLDEIPWGGGNYFALVKLWLYYPNWVCNDDKENPSIAKLPKEFWWNATWTVVYFSNYHYYASKVELESILDMVNAMLEWPK